jgi:pantothenate kinase
MTHKVTGYQRTEHVCEGESVGKVQSQITAEFVQSLVNVDRDLKLMHERVRCSSYNAGGGTLWQVEHIPSQRTISAEFGKEVKDGKVQIVDLLIEELWREGIISIPSDSTK